MGLSVQCVSARGVCPPPEVWGQREKVRLPVGSAFSATLPTQKPHLGQRSGEKPSQTHPTDDSTWGPPLGPCRGRLTPGHRGALVRTPRTLPPPGGGGEPSQGDSSFHLQAFHACHT